jgi:predicted DNA-binding transcriptional regulator AlpA
MSPPPTASTKLLSPRTLADMLDVNIASVWAWVKSGRLPNPLYVGPSTPRWREDEVLEALEKMRANPSSTRRARRMRDTHSNPTKETV